MILQAVGGGSGEWTPSDKAAGRQHFKRPEQKEGRLAAGFCNPQVLLVDLIGIELMTSFMPFTSIGCNLLKT